MPVIKKIPRHEFVRPVVPNLDYVFLKRVDRSYAVVVNSDSS